MTRPGHSSSYGEKDTTWRPQGFVYTTGRRDVEGPAIGAGMKVKGVGREKQGAFGHVYQGNLSRFNISSQSLTKLLLLNLPHLLLRSGKWNPGTEANMEKHGKLKAALKCNLISALYKQKAGRNTTCYSSSMPQ